MIGRQLKRFFKLWRRVSTLIATEFHSKTSVPLRRRMFAWRNGFLSESLIIYQLDENNTGDYLSDYDRLVKTPKINGKHSEILNNKIIFNRIAGIGQFQVPSELFWINKGTIFSLQDENPTLVEPTDILDLCRDKGRVIVKPVAGGGGKNVLMLEANNDQFYVNTDRVPAKDLEDLLRKRSNAIVTEFVKQHQYATDIFPLVCNSIRIVTMWDYQTGSTFVAAAVHRFGRTTTIPVDNWSRGGLSVFIDIEQGRLGKCVARTSNGAIEWYSAHPDSHQKIEGLEVPHWSKITEQLLLASNQLPFTPYIGWDVVVTDAGFRVLEGNNYSDVNLIQAHAPLLRDPRVRRFFEHHGII